MILRPDTKKPILLRVARLTLIVLVVFGFLPLAHTSDKADADAFSAGLQTAEIIAPNVFTPNGDDKNDIFEVTSTGGEVVALKVFTRAGVLVFSIEARRCRWDGRSLSGREMANGIYFYTAEVPGSSPKISKSGFVHLYR